MELTKDILALRPYLFSIAYNMLGVVEEAEDIVHDVYEKWIPLQQVQVPRAYLGRMTVNQCIARLNELKKLREQYTGPWLPEPYITLEPDPQPTVEYGLLFLLERLNPVERAVFILRESFSEDYGAIAEWLGLSPENCRQVLHRAHDKLGRSKAQPVDPARQQALTEAFLVALENQDRSSLDRLLRSDIELYSDGGGKRAAGLKPFYGIAKVLKFLLGVMQIPGNEPHAFETRPAFANGQPVALIFRRSDGELDSMQYVEVDHAGISRLLYVRNPDKLKIRGKML